MSGPSPDMTPTEMATAILPAWHDETVEAAAVSTGPASPSPTATSSSEQQPSTAVEHGNDDPSLSTPPLANSPLPLEKQHSVVDPTTSSESSQPLKESSSPADDVSSLPPPLLEDGLTNDTAFPAVAMQQVSRDPVGNDEPLHEAGNNGVTEAAGANAQSFAEASRDGTRTSGVEGTATPAADNKATANSAADNAGKNALSAAPTPSETTPSIESSVDIGDPVNDDRQVEQPWQSSEELPEVGAGSSNLNVEVAPLDIISTGPSLPSPGLEGTAVDEHDKLPTTTALSFVGDGENQSCARGKDKGEEADLPPLDRAEDESSSIQPDDVTGEEGDNEGSNVSKDDPEARVVPSEDPSGRVAGQEAEPGVEVSSSVDAVHQAETENGEHLESPPEDAENRGFRKDSTQLKAADQDRDNENVSESPVPSLVLAKEADAEDGDLKKARAEADVAENASAITEKTSVPEESAKEATPTTITETVGDLLVAGGTPLEPQIAEDVVRDSITTDRAENVEATRESTQSTAGDSIDANLEEEEADPMNTTTIDGASVETSPLPPGGSYPRGPVSIDAGSLDAPVVSGTLESGGDLSDAEIIPRVVDAAQQGRKSGGDDAGLHSPSTHTEDTTAADDVTPNVTDLGNNSNSDAGTAAAVVAAESESRAEEAATTPSRADDEENSHLEDSMSARGHVVSTTGVVAPSGAASESVECGVLLGEEGEPKSAEAGTGVASTENAAVQGDGAVEEEGLVRDAPEPGTETNPTNNFDRGGGDDRSLEVFDDLSSSVGEATEGEGAKSEGGANRRSIEEGPDTSDFSLEGEEALLGGQDGGGGGGKGAEGIEAGTRQMAVGEGLASELLTTTASFENKGG